MGAGGRWFASSRPDHFLQILCNGCATVVSKPTTGNRRLEITLPPLTEAYGDPPTRPAFGDRLLEACRTIQRRDGDAELRAFLSNERRVTKRDQQMTTAGKTKWLALLDRFEATLLPPPSPGSGFLCLND